MLTPLNVMLAILLAVASLGFYACWIEPRRLVVTELTLPLKDLPEKIRLVMIADPQPSGPHHTAERLQKIMARAAGLQGDIIVLLGDYVSIGGIKTSFTEPADTVAALGSLKAPMGVYAVLGNHDWWWGGRKMRHLLEAEGIVVLEDDARLARHGAKALWIAGLRDPVTRRYDLHAALSRTDTRAPVILLSHTPDVFPEVPAGVALTLAGHTHGGQVYIPLIGRPVVSSKYGERYALGHIVEHGRHLIVSSGIGTAILPVRFLTPPELVVITLTPAATPKQTS